MFREALFIKELLTKAQVSPGVTHNSLSGLSTQAILMGIPFPHTLGCPALAGYSTANTPFTKVLLSSGDDMHHGRISSCALRSLK